MKAGDKLSLKLNPNPERRESAVSAFHGEMRIGHVQAESRWVREALEEGDKLEVVVEGWDHVAKNLASVDIKVGVIDVVLPAAVAAGI